MRIIYSPKFAREYRKLPQDVKLLAEEKERVFREDPLDPRLKTHKLHGFLRDFWSFSIGYRYRIVFEFGDSRGVVYFYSVGNHDIYQ